MRPTVDPRGLAKTTAREYLIRFVFGGLVTAGTGLIAHSVGPEIGGLFLAFPAILPASLTLVQQHDGRSQAVDAARGACVGSLGLAAFAMTVWFAALTWSAVLALGAAVVVWAIVNGTAWLVALGQRAGVPQATAPLRVQR